MRSRIVRLVATIVCLLAPLGWTSIAHASTTATVEVTGQVVSDAMSLSLSSNAFAFGDIDATGSSYNASDSTATPFSVLDNALGFPLGTAWFARQPIVATITSPSPYNLSFCTTSQQNVSDETFTHLYMAYAIPTGNEQTAAALDHVAVVSCSPGPARAFGNDAVSDFNFSMYPAYLVRSTDTPSTFSATVLFTLSAL